MSHIIASGQLGPLGHMQPTRQHGWFAIAVLVLAACSSMAGAEQRGALEITGGIHLAPPAQWQVGERTRNSVELVKVAPSDAKAILARTLITTENRASPEEAVQRLAEIAAEQPQAPALLTIGGWPAIERKITASLPRTGSNDQTPAPPPSVVTSTVAIAAGATIVRFETTLMQGADPRLLDELLGRVRQLDFETKGDPKQAQRALDQVRQVMRKRLEAAPPPPPAPTAPHGS